MKVRVSKMVGGWYMVRNYAFTNHFFDSWRKRVRSSPDEEKIVRSAYGRLLRSQLIKLDGAQELREHEGLVFVIQRKRGLKIVKTVMLSFETHRIQETDYYQENKTKLDAQLYVM
jgi:hypothetical protein